MLLAKVLEQHLAERVVIYRPLESLFGIVGSVRPFLSVPLERHVIVASIRDGLNLGSGNALVLFLEPFRRPTHRLVISKIGREPTEGVVFLYPALRTSPGYPRGPP